MRWTQWYPLHNSGIGEFFAESEFTFNEEEDANGFFNDEQSSGRFLCTLDSFFLLFMGFSFWFVYYCFWLVVWKNLGLTLSAEKEMQSQDHLVNNKSWCYIIFRRRQPCWSCGTWRITSWRCKIFTVSCTKSCAEAASQCPAIFAPFPQKKNDLMNCGENSKKKSNL